MIYPNFVTINSAAATTQYYNAQAAVSSQNSGTNVSEQPIPQALT